MEAEPQPEPLNFTCPECLKDTPLIQGNTAIYKFPDPRYNFVFVVCSYGCELNPYFIDEEDLARLDYIQPTQTYDENPEWVVDKYQELYGITVDEASIAKEAIELMHQHRRFLYEYDVQPDEF